MFKHVALLYMVRWLRVGQKKLGQSVRLTAYIFKTTDRTNLRDILVQFKTALF